MADYTWEVIEGISNTIDDVTSISIVKGRVQIQDPFRAGTATITGRIPSNVDDIEIGDAITILADYGGLTPATMFLGFVADVKINYGIISEMDTWEIHCEDILGLAGRAATSDTFAWGSNLTTFDAASLAATDAGLTAADYYLNVYGAAFGAGSYVQNNLFFGTRNLLELLNVLIATEQGRLYAMNLNEIGFISRRALGEFPVLGDFTDGTLVTVNDEVPFDTVVFRSLADSYFTKVIVKSDLGEVSAGTGDRVFEFYSLDGTLSQQQDLADYILQTLVVNRSKPMTVSCTSKTQFNEAALFAAQQAASGIQMGLILRGESYNLFVEGSTVTVDPSQTRFTFNVVSSDALNFFILDSTVFGRLDTDKLGF